MFNFSFSGDFRLETGEELAGFELAYHTFGALNKNKSNVVWIFHALTANSNPTEWWNGLVGNNKLISPEKNFIVCVNMPGSFYGSTNPLSINKTNGKPYYNSFPIVSIRDMVGMYELLRKHLKIDKINFAIGGSMGGMQLLEWAIINPNLFDKITLIATNAKHSPWGIALNTTQRMAIEADSTWLTDNEDAGINGLYAARAIAMLSYRNHETYNAAQAETNLDKLSGFKAESYQYYQANKLALRFNALSYYALTRSMDTHNVARNRQSIAAALKSITAQTLVIGIASDLLFPIAEQLLLFNNIPNAQFKQINSPYGHDGFLIEFEQLTNILSEFLGINQPLTNA